MIYDRALWSGEGTQARSRAKLARFITSAASVLNHGQLFCYWPAMPGSDCTIFFVSDDHCMSVWVTNSCRNLPERPSSLDYSSSYCSSLPQPMNVIHKLSQYKSRALLSLVFSIVAKLSTHLDSFCVLYLQNFISLRGKNAKWNP